MSRCAKHFAPTKKLRPTGFLLCLCVLLSGCGSLSSNGPAPSTFVTTGSMGFSYSGHTATPLNTGEVLIQGGAWGLGVDPNVLNGNGNPTTVTVPEPGCELYNPLSGVFSTCAELQAPRYYHTATLLQNGKVLIAGGFTLRAGVPPTSLFFQPTAEIFDSVLGVTSTGDLNTPRADHTATLLNSGMVLIAGGEDATGNFLGSAELYDPTRGTFISTGSLNVSRAFHTATLLNNGMVLIAGGESSANSAGSSAVMISSAELYDPATGKFTLTGSLNTARAVHTASLLNNGTVLFAGGVDANGGTSDSAEIYDPATEQFAPRGSLSTGRSDHTATVLNNGSVLIAGGKGSAVLNSAELYNPATGLFTTIPASLNTARYSHTATLLMNGKVLLAGGNGATPSGPNTYALSSAELY